jgi:hypothetical protein
VGIGTGSPSDKLHIVGTPGTTLRIQDGLQAMGKVLTSDINGRATWQESPLAGRTIHTEDSRVGCPSAWAGNTALITQNITMARDGYVQITSSIIRLAAGRHDLQLYVDGYLSDQTLTFSSTGEWIDAHVHWSGALSAGNHTITISSPSANIWGCGGAWGSIDTVIFD